MKKKNKIQLVEQHIIRNPDNQLIQILKLMKSAYNKINYAFRQSFIHTNKIPNEYELSKKYSKRKPDVFSKIPSDAMQQMVKLVNQNWKSFFAAIKEYKRNPGKFLGQPKLPGYKKELAIYVVSKYGTPKIKNNQLNLGRVFDNYIFPIKTNVSQEEYKQLRIIPKNDHIVVEIVYEQELPKLKEDNNKYLSIDLGVKNFATCFNNAGLKPFIINGKILNSIIQFRNKRIAKLQSLNGKYYSKRMYRISNKSNRKIKDYLHKASNYIIQFCIQNEINSIIIGNNKNWKQNSKMNSKANQKFIQIPHSKFIDILKYKCQLNGINLIITEESYTSKIDHFAKEPMNKQENYLGKRIHRGLFKSSTNRLLNADVNGAIGIMRKVIRESSFNELVANKSVVVTPMRLNVA